MWYKAVSEVCLCELVDWNLSTYLFYFFPAFNCNAPTPADWIFFPRGCSDIMLGWVVHNLITLMSVTALNHSHWRECSSLSVLQKRSFSRLLPYCNYSNWIWAIALIGWGKAQAASTFIGWLVTSLSPSIGCLEESGRGAHPILPLWQSL